MDLDDCGQIARLDRSNLVKKLGDLHLQFRQAASICTGTDLDPTRMASVRRVVFCGVGGSAIGGDIVRTQLGGLLAVPFEVNRDYRIHTPLDSGSLVILSSYSGNTEETLSCLEAAQSLDCPIVAITSGGELRDRCSEADIPVFLVPGGDPPRSTLGYLFALTTHILHTLSLAPLPDLERQANRLEGLAQDLLPESPTRNNPAKQLALNLHGRVALVYGSAGGLSPVARRWVAQLAENGKQLAFQGELPEMNHNEIVGWQHPAALLGHFYPVFLRDGSDDPRVGRRFQLTAQLLRLKTGRGEEVWGQGDDRAQRLWSLILLGDFVSAYAGFLNREDPTPVEAIERFKKALVETEEIP